MDRKWIDKRSLLKKADQIFHLHNYWFRCGSFEYMNYNYIVKLILLRYYTKIQLYIKSNIETEMPSRFYMYMHNIRRHMTKCLMERQINAYIIHMTQSSISFPDSEYHEWNTFMT